ncbi:Holliday junction branch migration protein RuvA [Ochrovirga pacifica]|uniref:Holliday junction branch migration protein RuvA n=1 Tax=Ochrovirga pacifica TaxID=1042376 RepID=UPI00025591F4|nr:Holliday junction branch migration protein RuvA [Ochrovirga pacifica]
MITHLRGKLIEKNPTYAIVECNGVGYFLHISLTSFSQIPDSELITIYTHLIVREDAHTLYGFMSILEREIFKLLISVSGIGPSIARTVLSSLTTDEIQHALVSENVSVIQSVKGIGAKTAQKVILELKDKVAKTYGLSAEVIAESNSVKEEALSALEVLGYIKRQAEKVVNALLKETPNASVEELIKLALKKL